MAQPLNLARGALLVLARGVVLVPAPEPSGAKPLSRQGRQSPPMRIRGLAHLGAFDSAEFAQPLDLARAPSGLLWNQGLGETRSCRETTEMAQPLDPARGAPCGCWAAIDGEVKQRRCSNSRAGRGGGGPQSGQASARPNSRAGSPAGRRCSGGGARAAAERRCSGFGSSRRTEDLRRRRCSGGARTQRQASQASQASARRK
jgi:hypothetical protein